MRGDLERAEEVLPTIPKEQYNRQADFDFFSFGE
jgi:hypothetical protein